MKRLLTLLIPLIIIITLPLGLIACNFENTYTPPTNSGNTNNNENEKPHTHAYNRQKVEAKYIKSLATFTQKAVYYYSCACGEKGEESFEFGEVLHPTENLSYKLNTEKTAYTVTGKGSAIDNDIVIPATYLNLPVTMISENAFRDNTVITSITTLDGLTSIGNNAFRNCLNLMGITIADSVENIGDLAFCECPNIISVCVGANNNYFKNTDNCLLDKDDTLMLSCKSNIIPNNVKRIGNNAFYNRKYLTQITLPDSIVSIEPYAFRNCVNLTSVIFSKNLTSIGYGAFSGCSQLTKIVLPDGLTSIGADAFSNCLNLASIYLPNSVTDIKTCAFLNCKSITSVILPDNLKTINHSAFAGCSLLTAITIPSSITKIYENALIYCTELAIINFNGTKTQWKTISKSDKWNQYSGNYIVNCSDGKLNKNGNEI